MTTVTDSALARFNASIQKRSSIKWSLAGKTVDCTRYTRRPRTFSLTRTKRFPSEKRSTSPAPGCTCKYSQILSVSLGLPLPPKMSISSAIVVTSGAQSLRCLESNDLCECARQTLDASGVEAQRTNQDWLMCSQCALTGHQGTFVGSVPV